MQAQVVVKAARQPLCTSPTDTSTCALVTVVGPTSVRGDPQFIGLLGQSFQVHGLDGAVYALISEQAAQVNARFEFLTGARRCPTAQIAEWDDATPATAIQCWSHDGSYLSQLGFMTPSARLAIVAGPASSGFASVAFEQGESSSELSYSPAVLPPRHHPPRLVRAARGQQRWLCQPGRRAAAGVQHAAQTAAGARAAGTDAQQSRRGPKAARRAWQRSSRATWTTMWWRVGCSAVDTVYGRYEQAEA